MTKLTAWEIEGNPDDVVAMHAGPDGNGKYQGWITRGEGHNFKPLLSSDFQFKTPEAAEAAMRGVIKDVVAWVKEDTKDDSLGKLLSPKRKSTHSENCRGSKTSR